jgi:uncharacterized beta-barrel protein YwiB (DUF1934 family)
LKDTKENARITLISKRFSGEEKDEINLDTVGGYYERSGKFYIAYSEHKDMGMGDSRIVLKIEPDMITMRRMGDFQTVMVYKKNEVTEFIYRVPFGELNLKIKTRSIKNEHLESGGKLNFCYDLYAGGEETYNDLTITVKAEG